VAQLTLKLAATLQWHMSVRTIVNGVVMVLWTILVVIVTHEELCHLIHMNYVTVNAVTDALLISVRKRPVKLCRQLIS
jgi:hypothetical protein